MDPTDASQHHTGAPPRRSRVPAQAITASRRSKRAPEDQPHEKRARTKRSTSEFSQMNDAQFESLLPPPIRRRPRPEHNAKADLAGLASGQRPKVPTSAPLKFYSTSLHPRVEQPQAVASGSGSSSRTSSADRRAFYFWHHGHAQLYAFPSKLFDPASCTVLDLKPDDYCGTLPLEGDPTAHAAFVKAQACIPGCDFFDNADRKRTSSLVEHLQTCYKRRRTFEPMGRVDILARLARFQLAALNGEHTSPLPVPAPSSAPSRTSGATFAPTTQPATRNNQPEAAHQDSPSQELRKDTTPNTSARPLSGIPVFDPHRPPRELPPLTATPVFSHQVLTALKPQSWDNVSANSAGRKDGRRVADRRTVAPSQRGERAPSQPDPPPASISSAAASSSENFYSSQARPLSSSGGPASPGSATSSAPHSQPRRAEPVFHWRRVYPPLAASSIPTLQQGFFECSFCGQPATPPTAPVDRGLPLVGHHDIISHICQCTSIGEARAPILRLFGGPPLPRATQFASEGILDQGQFPSFPLPTPPTSHRAPPHPAAQTPTNSLLAPPKAVYKKKEPRAPFKPAQGSAKAAVDWDGPPGSAKPEDQLVRKEPTRLSVIRTREPDSNDDEDVGRTRNGGFRKVAPVPAPKRKAVRKAVLCSADDQVPEFVITVWGDASLHPRVSYRSEEFPRVLRPVSISHTSTAKSVVSSHAFVVPGAAVEAQGRLSVALASAGLRVPDECSVLLEEGMLQLDVRDGGVKWKLAGQLRL